MWRKKNEGEGGIPVAFGVLEPPLSDTGELCFEPAGHYVY